MKYFWKCGITCVVSHGFTTDLVLNGHVHFALYMAFYHVVPKMLLTLSLDARLFCFYLCLRQGLTM